MKKERGITLIALVITIMILLILVGVTISLVLGDNGILNKAKTAGEEYTKASIKEEIELAIADIATELASKTPPESLSEEVIFAHLEERMKEEISIDITLAGTYKGYEYWIDEKYEVHIEDRVDKAVIQIELELKKGTADLGVTVKAVSTQGEIVSYTYIIDDVPTEELTTNTYTVENLEPESMHKIQVLVKDKKGNQKYSRIMQVKTEARTYLYKEGDECVDLTGGWERTSYNCGDFTKEDTYLNLHSSQGNAQEKFWNGCSTIDKVDLTGYKRIKFEIEFDNSLYISSYNTYWTWTFSGITSQKAYTYDTMFSDYGRTENNTKENLVNIRHTESVEIRNDVSSAYIVARHGKFYQLAFDINYKIYNIWLEK